MQTVKIHTSQNITIDYPVAGLGERILGRLIDLGILLVLYFLLFLASRYATPSGLGRNIPVVMWIYAFIFAFYDLASEVFFNGQSIGKRVMKIKVISLDGARPTLGQYLLRWVFRMVDFTISFHLASLVSVASTQNKQRIGDLVAGTTLIKTEPQSHLENLAFVASPEDYQPLYKEVIHLTDKDIILIREVIATYKSGGNSNLLYKMRMRIEEHLGLQENASIDDLTFLKTIIKDYNHLAVKFEEI